MTNHTKSQGKYLPLAVFFIVGFIGILAFSLLWKIVILLQSGRFDGHHQFIVALIEPHNISQVVVFLPNTQKINVLTVQIAGTEIAKEIEVPVDIKIPSDSMIRNTNDIAPLFQHLIFVRETKPLTVFDKVSLWWLSQSVRSENTSVTNIKLPLTQDETDTILPRMLMDQSLYQESKSVNIINASNVQGEGNRLARVFTNIGINVISVTTGRAQLGTTIEYSGMPGYTVQRIAVILNKPASLSTKSSIADITVTIGTDKGDGF